MFQYDNPHTKTFSSATLAAMTDELYKLTEEYSVDAYPAKHREHLGASIIGEKCSRKLWSSFRWLKLEQFPGRMRRLFNRGHREEPVIDNMLTWMGFFTREIDPETKKQYAFSAVNGHYGGSGDSITLLPWFRKDDDTRILVEKKTNKDKLFQQLKKDKLKLTQAKHYAQMCSYGRAFKLQYGLYIAVNKDTDEIHYEFLELDWNYAQQLENKAFDIITAKIPPQRISDNPDYYECKYCTFLGQCHHGEAVEKNCRSCRFAIPIEAGEWACTRFNNVIPKSFIAKGCSEHVSINT